MQKVSDAPLKKCPHCGKSQLQRLMSAPVFRLKGGGWYETDFKGDQDNKRNLADRPGSGRAQGRQEGQGPEPRTPGEGRRPPDAAKDAKSGDAADKAGRRRPRTRRAARRDADKPASRRAETGRRSRRARPASVPSARAREAPAPVKPPARRPAKKRRRACPAGTRP
jgi:hypothetical protein